MVKKKTNSRISEKKPGRLKSASGFHYSISILPQKGARKS